MVLGLQNLWFFLQCFNQPSCNNMAGILKCRKYRYCWSTFHIRSQTLQINRHFKSTRLRAQQTYFLIDQNIHPPHGRHHKTYHRVFIHNTCYLHGVPSWDVISWPSRGPTRANHWHYWSGITTDNTEIGFYTQRLGLRGILHSVGRGKWFVMWTADNI